MNCIVGGLDIKESMDNVHGACCSRLFYWFFPFKINFSGLCMETNN